MTIIQLSIHHLKISKENSIYIGDSDLDIQTAINAGVRSVGITKGNFSAEDFKRLGAWKIIGSLSELIGIAEAENKK